MNSPSLSKKKLIRSFLIKAVIFFIGWSILFHGYIKPSGYINNYLTTAVANGTKLGCQLLGFDSEVIIKQKEDDAARIQAIIVVDNEQAVLIGDPCNGLELFALFVGFIVCFPGSTWPKVFVSIIGTSLLFIANIIREIALAFNYLHFRSSFDFNHKYTYAIAVYAIVFILWRYWLNHYSALSVRGNGSK